MPVTLLNREQTELYRSASGSTSSAAWFYDSRIMLTRRRAGSEETSAWGEEKHATVVTYLAAGLRRSDGIREEGGLRRGRWRWTCSGLRKLTERAATPSGRCVRAMQRS